MCIKSRSLFFLCDRGVFFVFFFFSSRRRHTRSLRDWSSDVCSSDLRPSPIPGPDGRPDWEKVDAISACNPETLHQAAYIAAHPLPASFAGTTYWGVHAFPATNSKGETRFIKFKVMPVGEEGRQAANEATAKPPDLLHGDLDSRIAARDIRFSVMALLDRPGDPVMDVTIRWPDEDAREALRLGTIVVTGVEANDACDKAVFNPANLAEGIGRPPDAMFAARCAAYAISQTRS